MQTGIPRSTLAVNGRLPATVDYPDEVSLAGGVKSDVPCPETVYVPAVLQPDGYHRGGLRWDGHERLWAPRRRMKAARLRAGLTQYRLAVATNLTVTSIANLERGRTRYPRMVTMERIAAALGVELAWLCDE